MAIKTSISIPDVFDTTDPLQLQNFCTAVKIFCDELARKAKSQQLEVRSDTPDSNSVEEGEDVRMVSGATIRTYTKISGVVRYHAES